MTRNEFRQLVAKTETIHSKADADEAREQLVAWFVDENIDELGLEAAELRDTANAIEDGRREAEEELARWEEDHAEYPICESCYRDIGGPLLCRECAGKQAGQDSGFWGRAAARLQEKLNRTTLELQAERLIRG